MPAIKILCLGDSLVSGGSTASGWRSFRGALQSAITAAGYTVDFVGTQQLAPASGGTDPDHDGYDGARMATSDSASNSIEGRVSAIRTAVGAVDVIVLSIGWADVLAGTASSDTKYASLLNTIQTGTWASADLFLLTMAPEAGKSVAQTGSDRPVYSTLNGAIRAAATSTRLVVDIAALTTSASADRDAMVETLIYDARNAPDTTTRANGRGIPAPAGGHQVTSWASIRDFNAQWRRTPWRIGGNGGTAGLAGSDTVIGHPYFVNTASGLTLWFWVLAGLGHSSSNTVVEGRHMAAQAERESSGAWDFFYEGARPGADNSNSAVYDFEPGTERGYRSDGITSYYKVVGGANIEAWAADTVPSRGIQNFSGGANQSLLQDGKCYSGVLQVRLALLDPNGPNDIALSRYVVACGFDVNAGAPTRYDYWGWPRELMDGGHDRWKILRSTEWTEVGFLSLGRTSPSYEGIKAEEHYEDPGTMPPHSANWSPATPFNDIGTYSRNVSQIRANPPRLPRYWSGRGTTGSASAWGLGDYWLDTSTGTQQYLWSQQGADRAATALLDAMVRADVLGTIGGGEPVSGQLLPGIPSRGLWLDRFHTETTDPDTAKWRDIDGTVAAVAPAWPVSEISTSVVTGGSLSYTLASPTGAPAPTLSLVSPPAWVSLSGLVLSGTVPSGPTSYVVTVRATNASGTADLTLTVVAFDGVVITTTTLPAPEVGTVYSAPIAVSGTGPFAWTLTAGEAALTALGLSLGGGVIFGASPVAGSATITVRATSPSGAHDEQAYTITVAAAGSGPTITTTSLATGTVGTAYSAHVAATGRAPFTYSTIAGALAAGLSLSHVIDYDVALTGAALRAAIGDATKYHAASRGWIIPGAAGARVNANARSTVAWQQRSDGTYEVAPHNMLPGSYEITTANGWSKGSNITENGLDGTVNGWPAYKWTSTAASNSFVNRAISVEVGQTYTVRFWCNATGAGWVTMGTTNRVVNYTKTLLSAGLYEWTATFTAATSETTATIHVGVIDAANGVAWRVSAPQVCVGSVACAHVPTHSAAVFGPAIDWIAADAGAYEIESDDARTQLWTYSARMTSGGWTVGPNLTANGPDGTLAGFPAFRYTSVTAGNSYIAQTNSCVAGEIYTASFLADFGPSTLGSGTRYLVTTPSNTQFAYTATLIATGVWEWSVTFTIPAGDTTLFGLVGNVDGGTGTTWRIAQPQRVLGARKPGKIPSPGASTVTRGADQVLIPDTSPSFIGASGGTLIARYRRNSTVPAATYPGVAEINFDDNNRVLVAAQPAGVAEVNVQVRNGGTSSVSTSHSGSSGLNRVAVSWSSARADSSQNGGTAGSDTSVTLPSTASAGEIRVGRVDSSLGGSVRELYYRAVSIPNAANAVALSGGTAPSVGDRALISGTPTVASSQTVLISAANDVGADDQALTLIVNPPAASGTGGGWSKWLVR